MSRTPIGVLLGAESLLGRRSGVGRMTLQIAQATRRDPDIAGLMLSFAGQAADPAFLDAIEDVAGGHDRAGLGERLRRWASHTLAAMPVVPAVRARSVRRHMNAAARELSARIGGPVVYHEPNMIAQPFDGVSVVTVNDLSWMLPDRLHPGSRMSWIERRLPRSLAQATRLVAISEFTAREMVSRLGVGRERIDVVPLAPSAEFRPVPDGVADPVLARHGLRARRFVLSVSTLEPRKNFDRLLAAHASLSARTRTAFPLVIAGGRGWGEALRGKVATDALAAGHLKLLGHVTDADLVTLYSRAAVFAYPSLYEGFGLPILEAMACGAPVITSSTTASAETAGGAAVLVDPMDTQSIARALQAMVEDHGLSARFAAVGRDHARHFTWGRTLSALAGSWRNALGVG
ncbi:MAG: glycosyltransferase family 4 protein [Acetobacteraceae bacterium]|nr:glycosyltransferase family 4 protein [Acetobacteraceae bacterium]